ncbi:PilN domain-containing protein [Pandoraea sp. PE-S2R-1]|uniref:PilN domain-containing protein n=1 Tax=Pandoraea sp. PE-S2R-1 TaxID=1986994 RepID=UPI000B3F7553|nr:PilN domain-containing protein [Pandoraea sp. PE-S2R-1]
MGVMPRLPPIDLLPTLAQRRQRDFRHQWRIWGALALAGALLALLPITWEVHARGEGRAKLLALNAARSQLDAAAASFDTTRRALAGIRAHRRAALALITRRQDMAGRLLDVMRACADGVRLAGVDIDDRQLNVSGFATTQSRVREMQKRLRSLPWVKKVAEVESSLIPEGVARQLMGANPPASLPAVRRFAVRVVHRPVAEPAFAGDDVWDPEEGIDDK